MRKNTNSVHPIFSICDDKFEKTRLALGSSCYDDGDTLVSINPSMLSDNNNPVNKQTQNFNYKNKNIRLRGNGKQKSKANDLEDFVLI